MATDLVSVQPCNWLCVWELGIKEEGLLEISLQVTIGEVIVILPLASLTTVALPAPFIIYWLRIVELSVTFI